MATTTVTQTVAGSYSWLCPPGVTSARVQCWAAGGAGGQRTTNGNGGGGGGGEYAEEATFAVTPGTSYPYVVGAAGVTGASPTNGGNSTFNTTGVVANGGGSVAQNSATAGTGGTGSSNTIHFNGGAGWAANTGTGGGGGGGSGGTSQNGNAATTTTAAAAVTGGGNGGAGRTATQGDGVAPTTPPGGGGGGSLRTSSGTRLGGAGLVGKVVITYTTPSASSITDDFTTQDTTKWTFGGASAVSGGTLNLPVNSSYADIINSNATFDLTGSSVYVQIAQTPNQGNGTTEAYLQIVDAGATNREAMIWSGGRLIQRETVAGSDTETSLAFDPVNHAWWRIGESGGTIFWDTSPDGATWTNRRSKAVGITVTSLTVRLLTGFYGTEPSPGTAKFDNVNTASAAGSLVVRRRPNYGSLLQQ